MRCIRTWLLSLCLAGLVGLSTGPLGGLHVAAAEPERCGAHESEPAHPQHDGEHRLICKVLLAIGKEICYLDEGVALFLGEVQVATALPIYLLEVHLLRTEPVRVPHSC